MSDAEVQRVRELFERCLEHPASEHDVVLGEHCSDPELRDRVRRMLKHHTDTAAAESGFMHLEAADPDRIGPYRILQRLGEGGMGIVYAAEQREPVRRRVAVKVLRSAYSSREVLARFDVERQALALMNHVNIARILDAGTTADRRPFIVMEFVPGESITTYCESRQLPLQQRLELFCTVCDAIQHAHQRGVIHRDLKPSNILIMEEDGKPVSKVIDFGIAKAISMRLTDQTLETKVGSLLGTPDYMSPEQAELSPLDVDTRADVYALGSVLYQLLTGVPPLQLSGTGKSFSDIQHAVQEQVPPAPSQRLQPPLRRYVRGELDWITLKAIEKQRSLRYPSAAELATDLRRFLNNETVTAGPPSKLRKLEKFVRRHWLGTVSVFAVIVTLAVSQMLLLQKNRELQTERDRANIESLRSASITAFLLDIFNASDPKNPEAGKISARELLDRSRKQIENDTSLPEEARLHMVLALKQAYKNLGQNEIALQLLEQARALYESSGRQDPHLEFEILSGLGRELVYTGHTQKARGPLASAIRIADTHPSIPFADTVFARIAYADTLLSFGNNTAAWRMTEQTYQQARSQLGMDAEHTWIAGMSLAEAYMALADIHAAEDLVNELLPVAKRLGGASNVATLGLQDLLATLYAVQGRREDAERTFQPVRETLIRLYGLDAGATQATTARYATTLADPEDGLRMLLKLLDHQRRQHSGTSPFQVATLKNIGALYLRLPDHEAAEHYLEQAASLAAELFGPEHVDSSEVYFELARLHVRTGRKNSAMDFLRKIAGAPLLQYRAARSPEFTVLRDDPAFVALLGRFAPQDSDAE